MAKMTGYIEQYHGYRRVPVSDGNDDQINLVHLINRATRDTESCEDRQTHPGLADGYDQSNGQHCTLQTHSHTSGIHITTDKPPSRC